jgi:uncharacterized membrane protein YgaE (UPF0421/DUF939 family)
MKKTVQTYTADFILLIKNRDFLAYILKSVLGALFCYSLYKIFPQHQLNWSIISVLLVLSPDHNDSVKLAFDRIKANLIGAAVGFCAFLIHHPDAAVLSAAIITTILICYFLKLNNPSRSALAALIIVLIQEEEFNTGIAAGERMLCVLLGCAVGLIITYAFAFGQKKRLKKNDGENQTAD